MKLNKIKLLLSVIILLSLVGCSLDNTNVIKVNVENSENLNNTELGMNAMVKIDNGLWYDSTTRIVYWWNGYMGVANCATTPTAYYAPNGLPYRYNPETNTFEEIKGD